MSLAGRGLLTRALLAAATVLVASPTLAGAAGARAEQTTGATPRLTLLYQPAAVEPNDAFTVVLGVEGADSAIEVAVDIYDRTAPGEVVGPVPERDPLATFPVVPIAGDAGDPDAPRTTGFTIQLSDGSSPTDPSWGYRLEEAGVYPVRIRLRGPEGDTGVVLMTAIIRLPSVDEPSPRTEVAVMVPVHRAPPGDAEDRAAAAGLGPSLAAELGPVLDALDLRPDLPATFSVTPDTLARLAADPEGADLVTRLREALAGDDRQLLDAPYVQIDPASLVAAGLADELAVQAELGRRTLTQLLQAPDSATWHLATRVDPTTVEALDAVGLRNIVLPPGALGGAATTQPVTIGPDGSTDRRVLALSTSTAFALDRAAGDDALLAGHRTLARLAASALPDQPARIVMTIDVDSVQPEALTVVLDALEADLPIFANRTVDQLFDRTTLRPSAVPVAAPADDLGGYPAALERSRRLLSSYEAMVGGRQELVAPYELALAISAARELPLPARTRDAASVAEALEVPFSSISVPPGDQVTLGARDARFPLPITSELDEAVRVVIELQSNDRLEFPRNRIETTLRPGRQVVDVEVRTRAPGATPVRITVRTPDDAVILAESRYTIRSTAVSGVGIVLTVGAVVVLAAWWGRHWRRNRGQHRHARRRRPRADV